MVDVKAFLDEIHIKNFLSLHDVKLPLKPMTILVGPNASGKTNVLKALELLHKMMIAEDLPPVDFIRDMFWAGAADKIHFHVTAKIDGNLACYTLELEAKDKNKVLLEELLVDKIKVISVREGEGEVKDEDNKNPIIYRSKKLALKSAGDYGHKPITSALTNNFQNWEFYDFNPNVMRRANIFATIVGHAVDIAPDRLDDDGAVLRYLLANWHKNNPERFNAVNEGLKECSRLGIEHRGSNGEGDLYLLEGYKNPIPLERASDGTLRLIAYLILLNQSELPSLIAIEEPERNLHPAALGVISKILEQLAEETQVIITTHSSQLLDTFNPDKLGDKLGILVLRNRLGSGTEVINLEEVREDREALSGWMEDFGIGSAIFDSQLLQDIMES